MLRKGEVVSLAIFITMGLLFGSLLVSGGPLETDEPLIGDFNGDNGNGNGVEGGFSANVLMGVYTPSGEPVEMQRFAMKMFGVSEPTGCDPGYHWDRIYGCVPDEPVTTTPTPPATTTQAPPPPQTTTTPPPPSNGGGGPQIVDYWQGTVSQIKITGENIKPASLNVLVRWIWDSPGGVKVLKEVTLDSGRATIAGDAYAFTADFTWSDTYKDQLQIIADRHGVNCKVDSFCWKFRLRVSCSGVEADSVKKVIAVKEKTQEFDTTYVVSPTYGTGALTLDANLSNYVDPNYRSLIPGDPAGLSVVFIFIVIFFGLWYKWGRKLLRWG